MDGWQIVVDALGVVYFAAWSISFYPQVLLNYRRKSTSGLSPSFSILNPLGFLSYAIYTLSLTYSPVIRAQYAARHQGHEPQVAPADIAFAIHALVLSLVNLAQVGWYRQRNATGERQRLLSTDVEAAKLEKEVRTTDEVSKITWLSIGTMIVGTLVGAVLVRLHRLEELDLMYWISYIKLYISVAKYVPQLWSNFQRRTTLGFSIRAILLDITGSLTSLLQLIISSIFISNDPSGILANPVKLGLSILTLGMDSMFVWQRYGLYGKPLEVDEDDA